MEQITICYLIDQFKLHTWITYTTNLENEFEKKERSNTFIFSPICLLHKFFNLFQLSAENLTDERKNYMVR